MATVLNNKELLKVIKDGIWTKLEGCDEEYTHYHVIDFHSDELLICYGGIDWSDGETYYKPHRISQRDKNKTWFFENPVVEVD